MDIPEKSFYYHYKHDASKGVNDHAYEVLGVALHTEKGTETVIYRPLYRADFLGDADFSARPLGMFMETVEKEGKTFPRFQKITDADILKKLAQETK